MNILGARDTFRPKMDKTQWSVSVLSRDIPLPQLPLSLSLSLKLIYVLDIFLLLVLWCDRWGRRDAEARIASAALSSPHVQECSFLYGESLSVMQMTRSLITHSCQHVPTERALIQAWRDAASGHHVNGVSYQSEPWRSPAALALSKNGGNQYIPNPNNYDTDQFVYNI